jgi:hypothetical protein
MPCSRGAPDFKKVCGYRVVRQPGGAAEIRISNSKDGNPFYRVLYFAQGEFTTRDAAPIRVARKADEWTLSVGSEEPYRFADAVIRGDCDLGAQGGALRALGSARGFRHRDLAQAGRP